MPMTPDIDRLWHQLRTFDFDGGPAAFTFRDRLARDTGWSRDHAARVIDEYRRFLLLAAAAGHPVTPSADVDEAWHLHLTYTRSYWEDLCGRVLPAPLHHGPTRGGSREAAKFESWYAQTLASYARLFDAPPPADIWPPAAVRFAPRPRVTRVDPARAWIVPKPAWWPPRPRAVALGLLVAASVTSACTAVEIALPAALAGLAVLGLAANLVMRYASTPRTERRTPDKRNEGSDSGTSSSCGSSTGSSSSRDGDDANGTDGGDSGGGDGGGGDGGGSGCGGGCGGGGD